MSTKKVYKYLSLSSSKRQKWFLEMVETGEVWFSKFHALNDPMEGVYYTVCNESEQVITSLKKNQYLLGCFGSSNINHHLWAYYADGYSGACIEFEINEENQRRFEQIEKIEYITLEEMKQTINPYTGGIKDLLNRKLKLWAFENEARIILRLPEFIKENGSKIKVGKIKGITMGVNINKKTFDYFRSNHDVFNDFPDIYWAIKNPGENLINPISFNNLISEIDAYRDWRKSFS